MTKVPEVTMSFYSTAKITAKVLRSHLCCLEQKGLREEGHVTSVKNSLMTSYWCFVSD